ncbi:MAG: hypothetical protein AB7P40_20030 [Chloroflexota bacterium]
MLISQQDSPLQRSATPVRRHRPLRRAGRFVSLTAAAALLLLTTGCENLPDIPNPFSEDEAPSVAVQPPATATQAAAPTLAPTAPATATQAPAAAVPTEAPAFTPFWVKNHQITGMWSGPEGSPGVVSFGTTSQQFCSFLVVDAADQPRVYVFNPYSQNYFWIDASAVGPVSPPEHRSGPPPANQNCAEAVYDG